MKQILLYFAAVILWQFSALAQSNNISLNLVYPTSNERLELTGKPFFLIGTIKPAGAKLKINESDAQVSDDGAFIGMAKIVLFKQDNKTLGKFVFDISTSTGNKEFEKVYNIKPPLQTFTSDSLAIDYNWPVLPEEDQTLVPGSNVKVEIKGTPGLQAHFTVDGINENFPMAETKIINNYNWENAVFGNGFTNNKDTVKGIYWGSFTIPINLKNAIVTITLTSDSLGSIAEVARGKISSFNTAVPEIIQTKTFSNPLVGRYAPDKGYKLFLDGGINLLVTGKTGMWYQCQLASDETVYVPDSGAFVLLPGTVIPHASIYAMRTEDSAGFVSVNLGLTERCPYKIIEHSNPESIELLIYNVTSNIDWVYNNNSNLINQITWDQPKDGVLKVDISLNEKNQWGYSAGYEGNLLRLKIKEPAARNSGIPFFSNQLKGRVIVLDPGHNPDTGALGPRGTEEKDVNLEISLQLKELLEDAGAKVYLTHTTNPLALKERKEKVNSFNPEISISIHNNAVPEGVNPLEHNGSSVYYYFPQALPLAKLVHKELLDNLQLNDFGLFWDNLYMTRIPESISILVEPAFMTIPDQEAQLLTYEFREKIAKAIFNAVKDFYKEYSQ